MIVCFLDVFHHQHEGRSRRVSCRCPKIATTRRKRVSLSLATSKALKMSITPARRCLSPLELDSHFMIQKYAEKPVAPAQVQQPSVPVYVPQTLHQPAQRKPTATEREAKEHSKQAESQQNTDPGTARFAQQPGQAQSRNSVRTHAAPSSGNSYARTQNQQHTNRQPRVQLGFNKTRVNVRGWSTRSSDLSRCFKFQRFQNYKVHFHRAKSWCYFEPALLKVVELIVVIIRLLTNQICSFRRLPF